MKNTHIMIIARVIMVALFMAPMTLQSAWDMWALGATFFTNSSGSSLQDWRVRTQQDTRPVNLTGLPLSWLKMIGEADAESFGGHTTPPRFRGVEGRASVEAEMVLEGLQFSFPKESQTAVG